LEQLLDTIFDVLGFQEYKEYEILLKTQFANSLLEIGKTLIILDNLETIKQDYLLKIWEFVNQIPAPSKVIDNVKNFSHFASGRLVLCLQ